MLVTIKARWSDAVLFSGEYASLADCLKAAVLEGAKLTANLGGAKLTGAYLTGAKLTGANLTGAKLEGANLEGANLEGAKLTGAKLTGANLEGANLEGAKLTGAKLTGANLEGANLEGAYLEGAYLTGAKLTGAKLTGAKLTGAYLEGANLEGANLDGANLEAVREDLFRVLDAAPMEAVGLRYALAEGRVDGSTYTGSCACLVGTIAKERGCNVNDLPSACRPDTSRPAERWFLVITPKMPESHPVVAITLEWIDEWLIENASLPVAAPV